jgi:Type I phosphodiesterase / nucleotide pyrophosphatase
MKKIAICLLAFASLLGAATRKPKLVVTIVVDQFRYDYLTRYRSEYTGGFNRLLTSGAVFTNANYRHVPAITAVGHSTILSGALPSISGIVGNEWFDPDDNARVTSVSDPKTKLVGGKEGVGSSPRRMLVNTIGDEIKIADGGKSRTIGISLKDRSAILPGGHTADAAYWMDTTTGNFVSSTYYMDALPGWARDFNAAHPADRYKGVTWLGHKLNEDPAKFYSAIEATPWGNELIEAFAERALAAEQLGKHEGTDLFTISFSSNDYVGHEYGPESPEAHDISVRTDRLLEKFFAAVEKQAGPMNTVFVLTADHGAPTLPEANTARKMPGGRIDPKVIRDAAQNALVKKYGPGEWISGHFDTSIYLNRQLIAEKKLDRAEVQREVARTLEVLPHVFRVYTLDSVRRGEVLGDEITQKVINGYNLRRGPDVELIPDPFWMVKTGGGVTHGTPFSYDQHVPVIFMGPGIKAGRYNQQIAVNDIAPTLATLLDIETPAGSVGRVLSEILIEAPRAPQR